MRYDPSRALRGIAPFLGALLILLLTEWGGFQVSWKGRTWRPPALFGISTAASAPATTWADGAPSIPLESQPEGLGDAEATPASADTVAASATAPIARLSAGPGSLDAFYGELALLDGGGDGVIRVAHYGDSQIEGDRFSMDARAVMQERFGDAGLGWVPIVSEVSRFRTTVRHTFGDDWRTEGRGSRDEVPGGLGPAGFAWSPRRDAARVTYAMPTPFRSLVLALGPSTGNTRVDVRLDSTRLALDIPPRTTDTAVVLRAPSDSMKRIELAVGSGTAVYGAWLGQGRGVAVDNFARRGSNGLELSGVRACAAARTPAVGRYRLVVLQFGLNVMTDQSTSYGWYAERLRPVIRQLRSCFPGTSILVMGPSLRGVRTPGGVRELRGVEPLAQALRALATTEGAAYWDQALAMRQRRDVAGWVRAGALADLTHYSNGTARDLGREFADDLIAGYDAWRAGGAKSPVVAAVPRP